MFLLLKLVQLHQVPDLLVLPVDGFDETVKETLEMWRTIFPCYVPRFSPISPTLPYEVTFNALKETLDLIRDVTVERQTPLARSITAVLAPPAADDLLTGRTEDCATVGDLESPLHLIRPLANVAVEPVRGHDGSTCWQVGG